MADNENMMTEEEMLELDDSAENDSELRSKLGEEAEDVRDLDDLDGSQVED